MAIVKKDTNMGWCGYSLYSGDGTQTSHYDFIKTAIPSLTDDDIGDFLLQSKTKIPQKLLPAFRKGIPAILKKIDSPKKIFWDEDKAIEWQMLLSLFVDNNLKVPHKVLVNGMIGSFYLLGEHSADFTFPSRRRAVIRKFMKKVDEKFCTVKARKEIKRFTLH